MPEGRRLLLAFDYGLKRIGVATGNALTRTASPLTTLNAATEPPWQAIDTLVAEWQPDLIVVGRPLPSGYGAYNVPYGYRGTYYDSDDYLYRYNNGRVYQVDPETRLVLAAIDLLI